MSDGTWRIYYAEAGGLVTFDVVEGLPRELAEPVWFAERVGEPKEYRLPRGGRWVLATAAEVEAAKPVRRG